MSPDNTSETAGKSLRILRPSIVVLCGPAACGKSTFAQKHFRPTQVISSDWARALVCDDERDQRFNPQTFALVHFLAEQRLMLNRLCVVDSTALSGQARKDLLSLARRCQVPTTLLLFNVPLEVCLGRDEKRERSVGRAIVEHQYEAFELTKGTVRQEGFDQVIELLDDDLDRVRIEVLFRPVARSTQRGQRPDFGVVRRQEASARVPRREPSGPRETGQRVSIPQPVAPSTEATPARVSVNARPVLTSVVANKPHSKIVPPMPAPSPPGRANGGRVS
jgi:protein phosphatase